MSTRERVRLLIRDDKGRGHGHIILHLLPESPNTNPPPLIVTEQDIADERPSVQLLESYEYRFVFEMPGIPKDAVVTTDRPEVFHFDGERTRTGRVRTGLYTGTLPVTVFVDGRAMGSFAVEVRSRKLDYLTHYEWMLSDLADTFAEVVMRSFGPTETRFAPTADGDAATLYQRFAFLKSMLTGPQFDGAMQHVLHNPHREWIHEEQQRPIGRSIPAGPLVGRALTQAGRRVPWQGGVVEQICRDTGVPSLPASIPVTRTHETEDTIPNRFVKYALQSWRETVAQIADALTEIDSSSPAVERGRRETAAVLLHLDELLAQPLFRSIGTLTHLPADNQVLQKRAGYRELYRIYVQFELAALLSWSGGDDVYGAGQKDVAVLYEYWVFIQIAQAISSLCDIPFSLDDMLLVDRHGLNIRLRRGQQRVLKGHVQRLGRHLTVEFWYNRTFRRTLGDDGSWTQTLRPDFSLRITGPGYGGEQDDVWLHFDAKYRLDSLTDVFARGGDQDEPKEGAPPSPSAALTDDLLKMHAYRDAIRRSSGAYVVYPGTEMELRRRYHEILPGLGAFALIPGEQSQTQGLRAIRQFIDDVLNHVGLQVTAHERHRYWERRVYTRAHRPVRTDAAPFLRRPPADTIVLLGYVRNREHYAWIERQGLYNLRADERSGRVGLGSTELAAEFVLLYGPHLLEATLWTVADDPRLLTRQRLLDTGYPTPGGEMYYCLPVAPMPEGSYVLRMQEDSIRTIIDAAAPGKPHGAPVAVTWAQLIQHGKSHGQ